MESNQLANVPFQKLITAKNLNQVPFKKVDYSISNPTTPNLHQQAILACTYLTSGQGLGL
jgi:hypothetical protein